MKIEGSVALITGANGGLGKEFIKALQAGGAAKIYACARKVESLSDIVAADPERIIPIQLDVTNLDEVNAAAARCQDVNLLINNAGISRDEGFIAASSLEGARAEMETNYFGPLAMCRAFAPVLKTNGGGVIVNLASLLSRICLPFMGTYCASKAAELSMTQGVRAELAAQGTVVIAVMPGTVDTPFAKNYPPPKVAPEEVVQATMQAIADEVEDVYPGDQAGYLSTEFFRDHKGVEKQVAGLLPAMYPFV